MTVGADDPVLDDALFLIAHPGWTPRDLAAADEELVMLMRAAFPKE